MCDALRRNAGLAQVDYAAFLSYTGARARGPTHFENA